MISHCILPLIKSEIKYDYFYCFFDVNDYFDASDFSLLIKKFTARSESVFFYGLISFMNYFTYFLFDF